MNKKGMLANIVGIFIVFVIGISLSGTVSQEIDNAINCNFTVGSVNLSSSEYETPIGATDSFGGGGVGQFGGYDGEVHKSWAPNLALIKTNSSAFNSDCVPIIGASATLLSLIPFIFIIAVVLIGLGMIVKAFSSVGITDY
jgi:hypothetical protein